MVFDASSATPSGQSLNCVLAKGVNKLLNIQHILTRFRTGKSGFISDIKMAYNDVALHEDFIRYQLYLWKPNLDPDAPTELMAVLTVIYGVRPSGNQLQAGLGLLGQPPRLGCSALQGLRIPSRPRPARHGAVPSGPVGQGRTGMCRALGWEHWAANSAERKEWTAEEDEVLRSGVETHGCKWRKIAACLPGRSDDAVRNRWNRLRDAAAGGRVATLLLYCRAPARGGATTFANARVAVAPRAGDAVFFSYYDSATGLMDTGHTVHSGCPVLEGEKLTSKPKSRKTSAITDTVPATMEGSTAAGAKTGKTQSST